MTKEEVSEKVEIIIDELSAIKEKNPQFDFCLVATWTKPDGYGINGDCAVSQVTQEKFEIMIENLIHAFSKQTDSHVSYYGNSWSENDDILN